MKCARDSDGLLHQLVHLPVQYAGVDAEDHAALIETVLVFSRDETIQQQIIESKLMRSVWDVLQSLASRIRESSNGPEANEEELKLLSPLSTNLVWCLSDIAAHAEFAQAYPLS